MGNINDARILVVDDAEFNRFVLREILESNGFHNIEVAKDGEEALEKTALFNPNLIILDLMMPKVDGYEYCSRVRKQERFKNLPIIVQTGVVEAEKKEKAFKVGVTDLVNKPVSNGELIARVKVHLERQDLFDELQEFKGRLDRELLQVREMQALLLPSEQITKELESLYELNIESHFQPSTEVGGDFWGMYPIADDMFSIYSVDFSGHGVTSALNTFRLHLLMQQMHHTADKPSESLTGLNSRLCQLLNTGSFATMFYGVVDLSADTLRYATAAAPNPFIVSPDGTTVDLIDGSGTPLGVDEASTYEMQQIDFPKGSTLFLYSDALIETRKADGGFITEETISSLIKKVGAAKSTGERAPAIMKSLLKLFSTQTGGEVEDDLTIAILERCS